MIDDQLYCTDDEQRFLKMMMMMTMLMVMVGHKVYRGRPAGLAR